MLKLLHVLRKRAVCGTSLEPQLKLSFWQGFEAKDSGSGWCGEYNASKRTCSVQAEALVGAEVFRHGALGLPLKSLQGQLHLRERESNTPPPGRVQSQKESKNEGPDGGLQDVEEGRGARQTQERRLQRLAGQLPQPRPTEHQPISFGLKKALEAALLQLG